METSSRPWQRLGSVLISMRYCAPRDNNMETQLLQLLIDNAPPDKRQEAGQGLLNGPQIKIGNADAVADQGQVDDLLASLGF